MGLFTRGVKVNPGARLPRLHELYARNKRWRLPEQPDPSDYITYRAEQEAAQRNYASTNALRDKVTAVFDDQLARRQVLKLTEDAVRMRFQNLIVVP